MLTDRHFPYSSMQEINLDWILTKVKNILRFVPDDGAVGQILRRTAHGAEWSDEQGGGGGAVSSVNGQTGAVVLTASDVGALPDTYVAPVDSVNGQTGTVVLSIPSDTSDLTNTAGFVNAAGAAAAAPVQSVNGQTGSVVLTAMDVGALPSTTPIPSVLDAYPIGSIYMSVNNTNPGSLFGGTWQQLEDRFLLGAGTVYTAGDTGGEATHTLTVAEMPAHTHKSQGFWQTPDSGGHNAIARTMISTDPTDTNSLQDTGGNQPHNNMPPYLVVYMWKRTA